MNKVWTMLACAGALSLAACSTEQKKEETQTHTTITETPAGLDTVGEETGTDMGGATGTTSGTPSPTPSNSGTTSGAKDGTTAGVTSGSTGGR